MARDPRERVEDILSAIEDLYTYVEGVSLEAFVNDTKTVRAVAYTFIVIGEAVRSLPDELRGQYPEVPWVKVQSLRNVAVHEYFRLDAALLWRTVNEELPPLVVSLRRMLEEP